MSGFQDMEMNEDETVRVGAGVNVNDIGDFLLANGRALRSMPGYGNITIAGAIGTGAHGSSIRYTSSISEQMVGLVIVDGQAQVQHISEEEDLQAFRVHLGLLGIIVEVTLVTQPLYKVHSHSYVTDDALLFNGRAIDLAYDAVSLTQSRATQHF
jgi:FAD/FMN-containing dehydrogenase